MIDPFAAWWRPTTRRVILLCRTCVHHGGVMLTPEGAAAAATGVLGLASWLTGLLGLAPGWLGYALGLLAAGVGGGVIVARAVRSLLARELNVDELVSVALVASVLAGEVLAAALVAFMMPGGKVLKDLTARRAERALEHLGRLVPATARVRRAPGSEDAVPVAARRPGDVVVVRPGERLPVDGVVIAGHAAVDQAPITGELVPVEKRPGHEVYAGSLATEGALEVRATGVGAATALGRIAALVVQAQAERAPIVRAADRYARYFTPLILALAVLTYLLTGQLTPAIAVLVVACPCALVLATATAVIAGVAAGTRRGLVIRGGARLEAAARCSFSWRRCGRIRCAPPPMRWPRPPGRASLPCCRGWLGGSRWPRACSATAQRPRRQASDTPQGSNPGSRGGRVYCWGWTTVGTWGARVAPILNVSDGVS